MKRNLRQVLGEHGVRPSAHRLAVAQYVLGAEDHPSADKVWRTVAKTFPAISRATVYNTLNLFVLKGLLREVHLSADSVVFDPRLETHHHFIDEETGAIHDIDWDRVQVCNLESLHDYEIHDYQVVMRGKITKEK
jgi:Fe2+ or Zn2+ uptake regulation protein